MNNVVALLFLFLATGSAAFGQFRLTVGDRATCPFAPTNFLPQPQGFHLGLPVHGWMQFYLADTNLPVGTSMRYEMFEGDSSELPICTGVLLITNSTSIPFGVSCTVTNAWQDLQGSVRLTMLNGAVTLHNGGVTIFVGRYNPDGYVAYWGSVAPIPDPQRLSFSRLSPVQIQMTWPTNTAASVLEQARRLPTVAWTPVTNAVSTVGGRFSVVVGTGQTQAVFRLRKL